MALAVTLETEIVANIVTLDGQKIREYIRVLSNHRQGILSSPHEIDIKIRVAGKASFVVGEPTNFLAWIDEFRNLTTKPRAEPDNLI